jgi:hypothetical protein
MSKERARRRRRQVMIEAMEAGVQAAAAPPTTVDTIEERKADLRHWVARVSWGLEHMEKLDRAQAAADAAWDRLEAEDRRRGRAARAGRGRPAARGCRRADRPWPLAAPPPLELVTMAKDRDENPGEDEGESGLESVRALASGEGDEEDGADIVPFAPKRAAKPYRPRHDGFTPARQKTFFKVLKKTGCIEDACRACGISTNTVRRWRNRWAAFDEKVECALAIASVELDMIAYKRATEGAEEKVFRDGKLISTKVKPSDAMLRLLMQGADPEKYGRTGQMPKGAVLRELKKQAEAEVRAKYRAVATEEELIQKAATLLGMLKKRRQKAKLAGGYTPGPEGLLIPPGWRIVRDLPALPPPDAADGPDPPDAPEPD